MESLRDLFVTLGLDADAASFASAQSMVDLLEKGLELAVEAVEKLAEVFAESVVKTAEYGEEMEVLAQKTGIGVEAIERFSYAAQLSHSSAEDLQTGLAHLAREIEKAKDGGEEAQKAFHKIGITMDDVRKKTPEEMFLLLADRMKATTSASVRTASAMDILGRGGVALIPTLMLGSEGLREYGVEADQLNTTMDEAGVHAAAEFKQSLEKLQAVMGGLQHMIAGPLMDALQPMMDEFIIWLKLNRQLIQTKITEYVTKLGKAIQFMVGVVRMVAESMEKFVIIVKVAIIAYGAFLVAQQLLNVGLGQTLVNLVLNSAAWIAYAATVVWAGITSAAAWLAAAAPVILLTAALTVAALAMEDFYVYLQGGDSVIGDLGPKWAKFVDEFFAPHPGDGWFGAYLRSYFDMLFNFEKHWDAFMKKVEKPIEFLFGRSENHVMGAWESQDERQSQQARTHAAVVTSDMVRASQTQGVMASGTGGQDYGGTAPWRTQSSSAIHAPINVFVPPGTPPDLVGKAAQDGVQKAMESILSPAAAATGSH